MLLTSFNIEGNVFYKGTLVGKDDTFLSRTVIQKESLYIIGQTGSLKVTPIPWRRSPNVQNESYTSGNANCPDALKFRA